MHGGPDGPRFGTIVAGGLGIEVTCWGPTSAAASAAPPIILLHHGFGSVAAWRSFPGRLAAALGPERPVGRLLAGGLRSI